MTCCELCRTMALAHYQSKIIGRGRSAVAAAAYRHRAAMEDASLGKTWSYRSNGELAHAELALPDASPEWIKALIAGKTPTEASALLWNVVTRAERRFDAQYAREVIAALPRELTRDENIALVRQHIAEQLTSRGHVADWVYHDKPGNPHVHIMMTLRPLAQTGFGLKRSPLRNEHGEFIRTPNGAIRYQPFGLTTTDYAATRLSWGELTNKHLAMAGHEASISMLSYAERGIALTPGVHRGPDRSAVRSRGLASPARAEIDNIDATKTREIEARAAVVLELITDQKSTFDERDIARWLHYYIDDPESYSRCYAAALAAPDLVILRPEIRDPDTATVVAPLIYSTRSVIELERKMAEAAAQLQSSRTFAIEPDIIARAILATQTADLARPIELTDEQRQAVAHVTGPEAISAVVGLAGAGKSTLVDAANRAWIAGGHRVHGAALSGKAAEGLQHSSGMVVSGVGDRRRSRIRRHRDWLLRRSGQE